MDCDGLRLFARIGLTGSLLAVFAVSTALASDATLDRLEAIEADALDRLAGDSARLLLAQSALPRPVTVDQVRALKRDRSTGSTPALAAPAQTAPRPRVVDCTKGQSIQAMIDQNAEPLEITIVGVCNENVRIERKRVTLRGQNPGAVDGIQGVATDRPALLIAYTEGAVIDNLSISNGPLTGVGISFSQVVMSNCRVDSNGGSGINVSAASLFNATDMSLSHNTGRGLSSNRSSAAFCVRCTLDGNGGFAAQSSLDSIISVQNSVITGARGLAASTGSYVDLDCVSVPGAGACGLTATLRAGQAVDRGTVAFYGTQDFSGQILVFDRSHVFLYGARQLGTGTGPGGGTLGNGLGEMSTLLAGPYDDGESPPQESQLKGRTDVSGFSRALITGGTVIDGDLECSSAGDAWIDLGVTVTAGGAITGCENATTPP